MEALDKETIDRILSLRDGLSQESFAEKIHSSQSNMSRLFKKGQASYSTLISIAKTFDVTLDWLLGLSDKKKPDGRIPPSEMTYADIISVAIYLYDIGATEEGWYNSDAPAPQYIEINDPVLEYLVESHFQAKSVDSEMRKIWLAQQLETFSSYKVLPFPPALLKEFKSRFQRGNPSREDILHLLDHPEDYISEATPSENDIDYDLPF